MFHKRKFVWQRLFHKRKLSFIYKTRNYLKREYYIILGKFRLGNNRVRVRLG